MIWSLVIINAHIHKCKTNDAIDIWQTKISISLKYSLFLWLKQPLHIKYLTILKIGLKEKKAGYSSTYDTYYKRTFIPIICWFSFDNLTPATNHTTSIFSMRKLQHLRTVHMAKCINAAMQNAKLMTFSGKRNCLIDMPNRSWLEACIHKLIKRTRKPQAKLTNRGVLPSRNPEC